MKATDFDIKITNTKTKHSIIVSLSDLQGYEGEDCGVFVSSDNISDEDLKKMGIGHPLGWIKVSNKSGYSDTIIDWNLLDFEYIGCNHESNKDPL